MESLNVDRRQWLQFGGAFCTPLVVGGAAFAYALSTRTTQPIVSALLVGIPLGLICVPVTFIVVPFVRWCRHGFPGWNEYKLWASPDASPALIGLGTVFFIGLSGVYLPALIVFEQTARITLSLVVLSVAVPLLVTFGVVLHRRCPVSAGEASMLRPYLWMVAAFVVVNGLNIASQLEITSGAIALRTKDVDHPTYEGALVLGMCDFVIGLISMAPIWLVRYRNARRKLRSSEATARRLPKRLARHYYFENFGKIRHDQCRRDGARLRRAVCRVAARHASCGEKPGRQWKRAV